MNKNQNTKTIDMLKIAFMEIKKYKSGKKYLAFKLVYSLINSLIPFASIIFPGLIINSLIGEGGKNKALIYVTFLLLIPLFGNFIGFVLNNTIYKYQLELKTDLTDELYRYSLGMEYELLEQPDYQVKHDRADKAIPAIINDVELFVNLISAFIGLVLVLSLIATLNAWIILLILIIILFNSIFSRYVTDKKSKLNHQLGEYDMYQGAYSYMLEHSSYAKEIRLFDTINLLLGLFTKSKRQSNMLEIKYKEYTGKNGLFQNVTNTIEQFILYVYLILKVVSGEMLVGDLTIYLASVSKFASSLKTVFDSYMAMYEQGKKINDLNVFYRMGDNQLDGNLEATFTENSVFEFRNVSFKYPGSQNYAIKNLSFSFKGNECLCIVGSNGSGKTTFVKLLLRLYRPCEGQILLDGIDINSFTSTSYWRLFAPVFQDYVMYTMSLGNNISLTEKQDIRRLEKICKENGLSELIGRLPKKYDTQIEKWLDPEAVELSGGEEQRVAIARACYKDGFVYVLDEPTSAIDPLTEYEIYKRFNEIITNKCSILITHRMAAVHLANRIAVFSNGNIKECGTHRELYDLNGLYTEMYDKQSSFYKEDSHREERS